MCQIALPNRFLREVDDIGFSDSEKAQFYKHLASRLEDFPAQVNTTVYRDYEIFVGDLAALIILGVRLVDDATHGTNPVLVYWKIDTLPY